MQIAGSELVLRFEADVDPEDAFEQALDAIADELGLSVLLERAAPRSHGRHRDVKGKFAPHPAKAGTPKGAGGKFIRRLTREESSAAATQAGDLIAKGIRPLLHRHLDDVLAGAITHDQWYRRCAEDIARFYEQIYRLGQQSAGNPAVILSPRDRQIINWMVRDERHYLAGFQAHLQSGGGVMDYHERTEAYVNAAREAYWAGWVTGDERQARKIAWKLGPTEHCNDCARFAAMGFIPARRFANEILAKGFTPQSGQLECKGIKCQCYLVEKVGGGAVTEAPDIFRVQRAADERSDGYVQNDEVCEG